MGEEAELENSFINALKLLDTKTYLSTGCRKLDRLLGSGIECGALHLFYGEEGSGIDLLLHQLMANTLENDGYRVIYLNCGNYREDKTILDIPSLVYLLEVLRLDPKEALDRIVVFCAFSEEQQEQVVEDIRAVIEQAETINLLVIHDMAKLFTSKGPQEYYKRIPKLQRALSRLWQVCAAKNVAVVTSCRPAKAGKGMLPKPEGGRYISHLANVIVYLEKTAGLVSTNQAILLKHSALPTGRTMLSFEGETIMGRITVPFKMRFEKELESLKSYRDALRDLEEQTAYDAVIKACTREQGAMANTDIPAVLDAILLTGLVESMKRISRLEKRFEFLEESLQKSESNE